MQSSSFVGRPSPKIRDRFWYWKKNSVPNIVYSTVDSGKTKQNKKLGIENYGSSLESDRNMAHGTLLNRRRRSSALAVDTQGLASPRIDIKLDKVDLSLRQVLEEERPEYEKFLMHHRWMPLLRLFDLVDACVKCQSGELPILESNVTTFIMDSTYAECLKALAAYLNLSLEMLQMSKLHTVQDGIVKFLAEETLDSYFAIRNHGEQNDFATHIVDEKLTAKLELVSGYMNIQNGEFAGSIEVKKMTGIGKRPRWKLRHVCTKGDCILIYSIANSATLKEQRRDGKWQIASLVHARVKDIRDDQRQFCMTIEVHTWAKQTNTQSGPKSYFVSTNNGESLLLWKTNLEERIANATKSFKVEMEQAGKEILSHDQFQSSLKLFFESSIEQIDTERPSNYKRKASVHSLSASTEKEKHRLDADSKHAVTPIPPIPDSTTGTEHKWVSPKVLYTVRAMAFFFILFVCGVQQVSISWIVTFTGVWAYIDYYVDAIRSFSKYRSIGIMLSVCYIIGAYNRPYFFILYAVPVASTWANYEESDKTWQAARKEFEQEKLSPEIPEVPATKNSQVSKEQLDWINIFLERAWVTLKRTTEDTIMYYSLYYLGENLPSFLSRVEIPKLEFGKAPQIYGLQVHDYRSVRHSNAVTVDLDIIWHDTPSIVIHAVTKAAVSADVALTELSLVGTLRIEFIIDGWENDIPQWPGFSALRYGFTKKPDIKFRMRAMNIEMMNVPLLSDWLDKLLCSLIASNFTYPNSITYPDWRCSSPRNQMSALNVPIAVLQVKIVQARLEAKHKIYGLYCEVLVDGEYRKQLFQSRKSNPTISGIHPCWNETFFFLVDDIFAQSLHVKLFSSKTIGKDELIGTSLVKLDCFYGKEIKPSKVSATLENNMGHVLLEVSVQRLAANNIPHSPRRIVNFGSMKLKPGILILNLVKGINLGTTTSKRGYPYVNLFLNESGGAFDNTTRSQVSKNSLNPTWDQTFYFIVNEPEHDKLKLQVMREFQSTALTKSFNSTSDEVIGEITLKVKDICISSQEQISQYPLDVSLTGTLLLKLVWRVFE